MDVKTRGENSFAGKNSKQKRGEEPQSAVLDYSAGSFGGFAYARTIKVEKRGVP